MRRIYVASSWRNEMQPRVVELLRNVGHEVYDFRHPPDGGGFHWSEIDPGWQDWSPGEFRSALQHPVAQRGYGSDRRGMDWADTCVMVMPCGRSAHLEAGFMAGQGKQVLVLLAGSEPELMYLLLGRLCLTVGELICQLEEPAAWSAELPDVRTPEEREESERLQALARPRPPAALTPEECADAVGAILSGRSLCNVCGLRAAKQGLRMCWQCEGDDPPAGSLALVRPKAPAPAEAATPEPASTPGEGAPDV